MEPQELAQWRKTHGYTQYDLGQKLGVAKTTVYRWEKSMREIPSFLHLALECLEKKGDELKTKGIKTTKERKVKKSGHDLPKR